MGKWGGDGGEGLQNSGWHFQGQMQETQKKKKRKKEKDPHETFQKYYIMYISIIIMKKI